MPFPMSERLRGWQRRTQQVVAQYWYLFVVIVLVVITVLVEGLRSPWGWGVVIALLVVVGGLSLNLLASLIHDWKHRRIPPEVARVRYLQSLINRCQTLPLAALGGAEGITRGPHLDDVYIDLYTTTRVLRDEAEPQRHRPERQPELERERETRPLPVKEALEHTPQMVLLGAPGSGKSTFVRRVLSDLATAILRNTAAPYGLPRDLLPILMTLRDLASHLDSLALAPLSHSDRRQHLADTVCEQAVQDLRRRRVEDFDEGLREAFTTGHCLLVLDGLDEVPYDLRQHVREAVGAVLDVYHAQRVIVTCRVRSYAGEAVLPGFQASMLADFDDEQIEAFAHAWYNTQKTLEQVDALRAEPMAADLARVARTDRLRRLAVNPLLLTTMAIVHQRETQLPEQSVILYDQAVEILLRRWQQHKAGEAGLSADPDLTVLLNNSLRLRTVMEGLAYAIHREQQHGRAESGLPRGQALAFLEQQAYLCHVNPANAFLNYVDEGAGLLVGQGGAPGQPTTYSFPHRTFQEYLAGCYLLSQRDKRHLLFMCASAGDFWSQAVQFGAEELFYNRKGRNELLDLAYLLCPTPTPPDLRDRRAALWSGIMAALMQREGIIIEDDSAGGAAYLERLRPCLVSLLGSDLIALERAEAGNALVQSGTNTYPSLRL